MCMRPSMVGKALFAIGLLLPGAALGVQEAYLKGTNTGEFDFFGSSVAVDGDVAVVGAPNHGNDPDEEIDGAGAAYIFRRAGGVWTQQRFLVEPSVEINHRYGGAVAVSSSAVAVASPSHLTRGAVFVYSLEGEAEAVLMASDGETDDNFGVDIDLSGNILLVGTSAANAGYVFVREDASWSQQAVLTPPTGGSLQGSVALSGDRAALGAQSVAFSSEVLVFARSGGVWSLQATIEGGGFDVDIDGNTLAVSDGNTTRIHVFSDGAWTLQATLPHGRNLSLSGDAIAVAGWDEAVHVFVRSAGTWEQRDSLVGSNTDELDDYASSLAMSGELVIVGASHEDSDGTGVNGSQVQVSNSYNAGAAYAFRVDVPLTPSAGGTLRDVNRFGLPGEGLAGATLTLFAGDETFATAVSTADGSFAFEGLDAPGDLYDLRVQLGEVLRVYQAIRPSQLDGLSLTLPVDVRARINTELGKLENTPPLFLAYDTAQVRTLLASWNSAQPEDATVHALRDRALGRLLIAAEGFAQLFASVEPLAQGAAKLTVDSITTVLSMREVVQQAGDALASAAAAAAPGAAESVGRVALQALVKMLDILANLLQSTLTDGVKATLPPFATELFEDAFGIIAKGVLGTFSSGAWNVAEGRKALLAGVVETLAQEVGGRVLGSAYVAQTQQDLQLAEIRTRTTQFDGTQPEAFGASNAVLNEAVLRIENTLNAAAALGDTGKDWSAVADASVVIGRLPGAQVAAALGAVIKGMSVAQLAGATILDYAVLTDVAFERSPLMAGRAFFPTATKSAGWHAPLRWTPAHGKALPAAYTEALAALRAALVADDADAALVAMEALLAAEDTLADAIDLRRQRLNAHAANGTIGFDDAARLAALECIAVFGVERALLYAQVAGYLLPALADPDTLPADIVDQLDGVSSSGVLADDALAAAEAPVQASSLPARLVVERHGLGESLSMQRIAPGEFTLRARLRNVGDVAIADAEVLLSLSLVDGSTLTLQLEDPAQQALGPIAAGALREVEWRGVVALPAGQGDGESVSYRLAPQFGGGLVQAADGGFVVANLPGEDIFDDGFERRP